ncbi:MAG: YbbR-like domain-containing protein [Culturomica sp.]|jgi:YbbR domain-containing protein|nr:YbbR-like domain-containing protein [Culturomica sp.]
MANKLVSYLKSYYAKVDRNLLSYLTCVLIASILWALTSLNKHYTGEIEYPVNYTDIPKGKYIVGDLPKTLTLEINAKGFALLRYKINHSFLPINFSLSHYNIGSKSEITVNMNDIKERLASQLNSSVKLLNIKPESITFKFSKAKTKTVKVIPQVSYKAKNGYILSNDTICNPSSVKISGPAPMIDTINKVYTKLWKLGEISKSKSSTVDLQNIDNIDMDTYSVDITVAAERFTEAKRTLSLIAQNVPEGMKIKLFPAQIDVTYDIGLSKYDSVEDNEFQFFVDYSKRTDNYLEVEQVLSPSYIKNLRYSPQKVEFILETNE